VTNFRVAVGRHRRGTDGTMVDETEWFRVVAWDSGNYKLAEICNEYLRKGHKVYVEGRLQSRKYTDKDGVERTSVEIVATDMVMLSGRDEAADGASGGHDDEAGNTPQHAVAPQRAAGPIEAARRPTRPASRPATFDDPDDEVPF
jgi:single-strand DNA-binding protein